MPEVNERSERRERGPDGWSVSRSLTPHLVPSVRLSFPLHVPSSGPGPGPVPSGREEDGVEGTDQTVTGVGGK